MTYKESQFNICIPQPDGTYIFYNTLSNALGSLDQENYQQYLDFVQKQRIPEQNLLTSLKHCGFIIDKEVDELMYIRRRMFEERFSSQTIILTIAPTMLCNFGCDYCFEDNKNEDKMSEQTVRDLVNYLKSKYRKEKKLSVFWMGGEPLLALDVITKLSEEFINFCTENDLEFRASIITNGYLLTPEITKTLRDDCQISTFQITLDGIGETHDRKRPLKNGDPTYQVILKNINDSLDYMENLSLRVNLDKENIDMADAFLDLFDQDEFKKKINLSFSLTNPTSNKIKDRCLSIEEFSKSYQHLRKKKIKRGFSETLYPKALFNPCGLTSASNYVIDSRGRIFKCWSDYGHPERSVDHISQPTSWKQKQKENTYLLYDPTTNPECRECVILPLCMGGCYWQRFHMDILPCSNSKFNLEDTLNFIVDNRLYEQQNTNRKEVLQ